MLLGVIGIVGLIITPHGGAGCCGFDFFGINIRMIDQGSSELNIIVGVEASDFENAVKAIYSRLIGV